MNDKKQTKLKVKAGDRFNYYRNLVLGLDDKDFKVLKAGKEVSIDQTIVNKCPKAFEIVKGGKEYGD